jgi:hypothetical protein
MAMFGVRLQAYEPAGAWLGPMPEPLSATAAFPHNDVGALSAKYSRLALAGGFLDRALSDGLELAVEVVNHAGAWVEPDGARFLWVASKDDIADKTLTLDVTAPSYGWLLNKARLLNLDDILPEEHSQAGKRPFLSASAGLIVATLQQENAVRGGVPLALGFDTGVDSAGQAWGLVSTLYYEPGISTMAVLENLAAQGMCDWRTAARELLLYNPDTALAPDLTVGANPVALQLGLDMTEAPSDQSIEDLVSRVLLRGDNGLTLTVDNPTAPTPWGPWEGYIEQGGVSDPGTATSLVQAEMDRTGRTRQQFTRGLVLRDDGDAGDQPGVFWPMVDYLPGAWILAPTTVASERVRVQQITLAWGPGVVGGSVVLHDRVLDAELRRAKRQAGIVGGSTAGGAGGGRPADPTSQDRRTPSAPLGLVVGSNAYIGTDGQAHGLINAAWSDVTTATDSTVLDVVGYDVALREPAGAWAVVGSSDDSSWEGSPYEPGDELEVRVRARGQYTTKPGVWSAAVPVTVAADVTPPAVPSTPAVSSRVGVITVSWDGLSGTGTAMDADFKHVEIAMGDTTTPSAVIGSLPIEGALLVQDQPYGENRYFRLRSVDTSDNASDWSVVSAPIAARSTAADDIDAAVNEAIDQALTGPVDGNRLEPWTVPGNRVLIANVTNALANPGFEDGFAAWTASPRASIATTDPHSGTQYVQVVADASSGTVLTPAVVSIPVEPGSSWLFSCWVRTSAGYNGTPSNGKMRIGNQANAILTAAAFPLSETWTRISVSITVPDDGSITALRPTWVANHTVGTLFLDDFAAVRMADAELVVDGAVKARHMAADSVTANSVAAGAVDGMIITGSVVQTAESGARIYLSGTSGFPGIWLYDAASPNWRVSLQVSSANVPGLWLRDAAGTELMRMLALDGGYIRSSYPSGRTATYISQGQLFVYSDEDAGAFPDILRTYWVQGTGQKLVYIGHQDSPVDAVSIWGDDVSLRSTSGTNGLVNISSRGTSGIQIRSYDISGTVVRGYADFSTTRMWLGQYGPGGGLGSRLNLVDGQAQLSAGDGSGSAFISAGPSSGVVQLKFGTGVSGDRRIEFVGGNDLVASMDYGSLYLFKNAGVTAGDSVVRRSSDGRIGWSSSSRRFKQDVEDHVINLDAMRALRPRSWRARDEVADTPETTNRYVGLVAEEVHDAGLVEAVSYEADGTPRNINDRAFIIGLIEWAKEHDARLAALEGTPAPLTTQAHTSTTAIAAATATGDVVAIPPPGPATPPTPTPAPAEHRPAVPPDHPTEVAQQQRTSTTTPTTPTTPALAEPGDDPHLPEENSDDD